MEIHLAPEDLDLLMRPVIGRGGWQSLLRKLQRQTHNGVLKLTADDSHRLLRYLLSYGSGGWQERLAAATANPVRADREGQ
jgi:hypothetical protein